jgi:hypothetical protein
MTNEIPDFETAVRAFQDFLQREGYSTALIWVFREDLWQLSPERILMRRLHAHHDIELAKKVFREGQAKGLVEVRAVAQGNGWTAATVWFPKYDEAEVQGWSQGMKLAIVQPLPTATRVRPMLWAVLRVLPSFRTYQRSACEVGTRRWAANVDFDCLPWIGVSPDSHDI